MRPHLQVAGTAGGGFARRIRPALWTAGPALVAGLLPVLFIPTSVDAYVLPRASLVILAGCGAALLGLWLPAAARPSLRGLGPLAILVAAAALLATAFSISPNLSFIGSYGRYESFPMRLAYLLLFCLPVWVLRTPGQRWWTVTIYLAGCTVASLEAIQQAVTGVPARPDGNLGHANLLAVLIAMAMPVVVSRSWRAPLWALCLLPLGTALIFTSSRSGWLGTVAGCIALVPLLARSQKLRLAGLAGAAVAVVAAAGALLASPLGRLHSDTGSARLHVWSDSLAMIATRPAVGWGPESQGLVLGRFLRGDWEPGATFDRIHQLGLDLLATQGLAGLLACCAFWGVWAYRSWTFLGTADLAREEQRHEVAGLLAAWSAFLVSTALNFDWTAATATVWLLAGVGWAACASPKPATDRGIGAAKLSPGRFILAAAGSSVVVLVAVGLALLPLAADLSFYQGDPRSAARLDPLQPRYHQALGEKLAAQHQPAAAAAELETARRLGTSDSAAVVRLGDTYSDLGQTRQAVNAYRAALRLNRYDLMASQRLRDRGLTP